MSFVINNGVIQYQSEIDGHPQDFYISLNNVRIQGHRLEIIENKDHSSEIHILSKETRH